MAKRTTEGKAVGGKKAALAILETELSVAELAAALRLSRAEVHAKFRDARVTSWFAEIWGERLYKYSKHVNTNHPGSDASISMGHIGKFEISVRCFCNGNIKFQKSKDIGSSRGTDQDGLVEALNSVECVVIVDLRRFPTLRFAPIDSKHLLKLAHKPIGDKARLGVSGLTPKRFDSWLADDFDVSVQPFTLPEGEDAESMPVSGGTAAK